MIPLECNCRFPCAGHVRGLEVVIAKWKMLPVVGAWGHRSPDRRLLCGPLAWVVVERRLAGAEALNTSAHSVDDIFDVERFAKLRVQESGRSVVQHRLCSGRHQHHAFGMT